MNETLRKILAQLLDFPDGYTITIPQLARALELDEQRISELKPILVEAEILRDSGKEHGSNGRNPVRYRINKMNAQIFAVKNDLLTYKIAKAVINLDTDTRVIDAINE